MEESSLNSEKDYNKESIIFPAFNLNTTKYSRKKIKNFRNYDFNNNKSSLDTFEDYLLNINNEENFLNSIMNNENIPEDNQSLKLISHHLSNKNFKNFEVLIGKKEKKKKNNNLGRKKKDSLEKGNHSKYTSDNLIRKCKAVMISILANLINKKIKELYKNDMDYVIKRKRLMKMAQFQVINSNIKYNKSFLNKTLKDIFSEDLSTRCTRYPIDHNRKLIKELLTEKDVIIHNYFTDLLNLSFLDCIKHLRGSISIKCLEDLQKLNEVCENLDGDEDYKETFRCYINNFENILDKKRSRKPRKNNINYIINGDN